MFARIDSLHDHLTIGFRRGCVACAQAEADMILSKRAYARVLANQAVPVNPQSAHPDREAPPFERREETKRGGLVARLPVTEEIIALQPDTTHVNRPSGCLWPWE